MEHVGVLYDAVINVSVWLLSNKMSDMQCSIRMVQRQDRAEHLWSSSHLCLIMKEVWLWLSQWWMAVCCIREWMGPGKPRGICWGRVHSTVLMLAVERWKDALHHKQVQLSAHRYSSWCWGHGLSSVSLELVCWCTKCTAEPRSGAIDFSSNVNSYMRTSGHLYNNAMGSHMIIDLQLIKEFL